MLRPYGLEDDAAVIRTAAKHIIKSK
jgi:hypothetical protein